MDLGGRRALFNLYYFPLSRHVFAADDDDDGFVCALDGDPAGELLAEPAGDQLAQYIHSERMNRMRMLAGLASALSAHAAPSPSGPSDERHDDGATAELDVVN